MMHTKKYLGDSDEQMVSFLENEGYELFRKLPDDEWIVVVPLAFSVSVCCGCDTTSMFKYRWCFSSYVSALQFYMDIESFDDIPKNKADLVGHRYTTKPLLKMKDENGFDRW